MTCQQIVDPEKIEAELIKLWEGLAKEKIRACLFNLIVFNELSSRTDYIRTIVQKVSEKYPCRVIFISSEKSSDKNYLKTAVSVVGRGFIACDYIDIGVSGSEIEKVPFLILPHLIPDLPITLLWTENPSTPNPLFTPLTKLSNRTIFDSESADNLIKFANQTLAFKKETADLNWARIEGWRDLISSIFRNEKDLDQIQDVRITYNSRVTESFCHTQVQSLYFLSWLAGRLKWNFQNMTKDLHFSFENKNAEIHPALWEQIGSGTILSVDIATKDGRLFQCARDPVEYHHVMIHQSSSEKCELPYRYILGTTASGHSLTQEIMNQGTSSHFIEMLKNLIKMNFYD